VPTGHRAAAGVTRPPDRTEIVDRTRQPPGDADGHAEAGSNSGSIPGSAASAAMHDQVRDRAWAVG